MIGHLNIGRRGATDLSLRPDATRFAVIEAKIYGKLSPGVRNAPFFDQAARSVACIAEILRRADRRAGGDGLARILPRGAPV